MDLSVGTTDIPSANSYRVIYENGSYRAVPNLNGYSLQIVVQLEKRHHDKYTAVEKRLWNHYSDLAVHRGWFGGITYTVESSYTLQEVVTKLLVGLNDTTCMTCKGCGQNFDYLQDCITHKNSCMRLWEISTAEKDLVNFIKTVNTQLRYLFDKEKEVVYEFVGSSFRTRSINTVYCSDDIKSNIFPKLYESTRFVLIVNKEENVNSDIRTKVIKMIDHISSKIG